MHHCCSKLELFPSGLKKLFTCDSLYTCDKVTAFLMYINSWWISTTIFFFLLYWQNQTITVLLPFQSKINDLEHSDLRVRCKLITGLFELLVSFLRTVCMTELMAKSPSRRTLYNSVCLIFICCKSLSVQSSSTSQETEVTYTRRWGSCGLWTQYFLKKRVVVVVITCTSWHFSHVA